MFYQFLIQSGVQQQLLFWRNQEVDRGNLEAARNHEQTWGALIDLLDEYVVIYGESALTGLCSKKSLRVVSKI